jgi:outer membrane protein
MTRIQKSALSVGAALLLGALQVGLAQDDLKIGYVNVPYLIQNAPQTQAMSQKLQNEFAPREADLNAKAQALQDKVDRFDRDASVMGEAEREALRREIDQDNRDLKRQQDVLQEDAQIRQNEMLQELQSVIGKQVQTYVEAEGYDLILSDVVYFSEAVDITRDVLQAITTDESGKSKN